MPTYLQVLNDKLRVCDNIIVAHNEGKLSFGRSKRGNHLRNPYRQDELFNNKYFDRRIIHTFIGVITGQKYKLKVEDQKHSQLTKGEIRFGTFG